MRVVGPQLKLPLVIAVFAVPHFLSPVLDLTTLVRSPNGISRVDTPRGIAPRDRLSIRVVDNLDKVIAATLWTSLILLLRQFRVLVFGQRLG